MLGKIAIALVTLWASVQATPTGNHTCFGVVKHPVTVRVNVTEPVTYRTYTWCLRVPPRCSKYIVQLKDRVKVQTEMHNKTITVCCKGYVEMDYKCVPACPPHNECPNMHCNRTNHCYCTPGYTGVYCSEPCQRGFWGKDCKRPCDCPDGYTCHHLTGDCMLDDSPPKPKKVPKAVMNAAEPSTTTKMVTSPRNFVEVQEAKINSIVSTTKQSPIKKETSAYYPTIVQTEPQTTPSTKPTPGVINDIPFSTRPTTIPTTSRNIQTTVPTTTSYITTTIPTTRTTTTSTTTPYPTYTTSTPFTTTTASSATTISRPVIMVPKPTLSSTVMFQETVPSTLSTTTFNIPPKTPHGIPTINIETSPTITTTLTTKPITLLPEQKMIDPATLQSTSIATTTSLKSAVMMLPTSTITLTKTTTPSTTSTTIITSSPVSFPTISSNPTLVPTTLKSVDVSMATPQHIETTKSTNHGDINAFDDINGAMFPLRVGKHDTFFATPLTNDHRIINYTTINISPLDQNLPIPTVPLTTRIDIPNIEDATTTHKPFKHPVVMKNDFVDIHGMHNGQENEAKGYTKEMEINSEINTSSPNKKNEHGPMFPLRTGHRDKISSDENFFEFSNHLPTAMSNTNETNNTSEISMDHGNDILKENPTNIPAPSEKEHMSITEELLHVSSGHDVVNLSNILNGISSVTVGKPFNDNSEINSGSGNDELSKSLIETDMKISPDEINIQNPILPINVFDHLTDTHANDLKTTRVYYTSLPTKSSLDNLPDKNNMKSIFLESDSNLPKSKHNKTLENAKLNENSLETNTFYSIGHTVQDGDKTKDGENAEPNDTREFLTEMFKKIEHNLSEPHAAGVQAERNDGTVINFLSGLSFILGCIAVITIVITSALFLRKWKRKREKSLMEDVILAYAPTPEAALNPMMYGSANYSVLRLGTSPTTFFCPTFTNNYAEQLNRDLCELNYDHPRNNAEPLYAEISN